MIQRVMTVLLIGLGSIVAAANDHPGFSKTKPAKGPSVKVKDGYMVPYTGTIPGTDIKFHMTPIPGGTFVMGSPAKEKGREDHEGPQVEIEVAPFWMSQYELTWVEYKHFMSLYEVFKQFEIDGQRKVSDGNRGDAITAPTKLYDPSFTFEYGDHPQQPAVSMTQYAARQYTKWLSLITGHFYRLPSEAEWEYACRAGTKTTYNFGDDAKKLGDHAWYFENAIEGSGQVGKKKPNAWGLYDMHGNAWEWVLDAYDEDGYKRLAGKKNKAADAILWPDAPYPLIVRGGSWQDEATECRTAVKLASDDEEWKFEDPNVPKSPWWFTTDPARAVGFRIIRPFKSSTEKDRKLAWEPNAEDIEWDVKDRLTEGRGVLGVVDKNLPAAVKKAQGE